MGFGSRANCAPGLTRLNGCAAYDFSTGFSQENLWRTNGGWHKRRRKVRRAQPGCHHWRFLACGLGPFRIECPPDILQHRNAASLPPHPISNINPVAQKSHGVYVELRMRFGPMTVITKNDVLVLSTSRSCGAANGIRTHDLVITNDVLYRLSYSSGFKMHIGL